ncbi:MAG: molybdopterin molybdotransferase MoeA [Planctomycetota bacterium]
MTTVDEARDEVRRRALPMEEMEEVPLAEAAGRVLAVPVRADRDDPPFDRAMMDGYAVRAGDTGHAPCELSVVGRVAAGDAELPEVGPGCAAWINVGAPVPPGADAVVPVERTRGEVVILSSAQPGDNVLLAASLAQAGEMVATGVLTPERVAVCAGVGADPVWVRRRPRVALLATGSELQPQPGGHQIRNSNGPMLHALLSAYDVVDLGVAGDTSASLQAALEVGLKADVLVTTGGVSKGELDLVRPELEARDVRVVFHRIQLQPGKPILFGEHDKGVVFALPGNPVSALVCADLFVLPYLASRAGRSFDDVLASTRARLSAPVEGSPKRRRVFPCVLRGDEVDPLPWRGSADLYTVTAGNAYIVIELGHHLAAGAEVSCLVPERFGAQPFSS